MRWRNVCKVGWLRVTGSPYRAIAAAICPWHPLQEQLILPSQHPFSLALCANGGVISSMGVALMGNKGLHFFSIKFNQQLWNFLSHQWLNWTFIKYSSFWERKVVFVSKQFAVCFIEMDHWHWHWHGSWPPNSSDRIWPLLAFYLPFTLSLEGFQLCILECSLELYVYSSVMKKYRICPPQHS